MIVTPDKSDGKVRNLGLDILRALAIIMVLIAHTSKPSFGKDLLAGWGVELFFALSGFLIGGILIKQVRKYGFQWAGLLNFWQRRWWRTLPSYYFWLFMFFGISFVAKNMPLSLGEAGSLMVFLQNFAWSPPKVFNVSWSLAVEEWFYLLYPLGVLGFSRFLSIEKSLFSAAALFVVISIGLRLGLRLEGGLDAGMRKVVCFRLDAIMYGVLAALTASYFPDFWRRRKTLAVIGLFGLIVCGLFHYYNQAVLEQSLLARNLLLPGISLSFALLISLVGDYSGDHLPAKGKSLITFISLISYSLYLSHIPCMFLVGFCTKLFLGPQVDMLSLPLVFIQWVVFFIVAWLAYKFIETPFMALREARVPSFHGMADSRVN